MEVVLRRVDQLELAAEVQAEEAEHARDRCLVTCAEEQGRPGVGLERLELGLREELRDRRADLAALVDDDVGEALRPPLLCELLEPANLRA